MGRKRPLSKTSWEEREEKKFKPTVLGPKKRGQLRGTRFSVGTDLLTLAACSELGLGKTGPPLRTTRRNEVQRKKRTQGGPAFGEEDFEKEKDQTKNEKGCYKKKRMPNSTGGQTRGVREEFLRNGE